MYWTVLAAANWATGQVNCQGQLGSYIAAYHGKLEYIHTYIYKLYISLETIYKLYPRMCVCVSLSHSTYYECPSLRHPLPWKEWNPKGCHSNNKGIEAPWTTLIFKSQLFLKYTEMVHFSGWVGFIRVSEIPYVFAPVISSFVFSLVLVDVGGCNDEKHNVGAQILNHW